MHDTPTPMSTPDCDAWCSSMVLLSSMLYGMAPLCRFFDRGTIQIDGGSIIKSPDEFTLHHSRFLA